MLKQLYCAAVVSVTLISTIVAHEFRIGELTIDHPMLREMPPGAKVGGGYLTIVNKGTEPDRLIRIESPAAEVVQLHQSIIEDGVATMRPLSDGLVVPAGATVVLGDNGTHAMFINPVVHFTEGQLIEGILIFEKAGRVEVSFKVEKITAGSAQPAHNDH